MEKATQTTWQADTLTEKVIGSAIAVHRFLGPGLLESAYLECLCYELAQVRLEFRKEMSLPVEYGEVKLNCGYRLDLLVQDQLVVEIKTVEKILPIHKAQLRTYVRLSRATRGLLINLNVLILTDGLVRVDA